jgi:protein-disulfide isomerase
VSENGPHLSVPVGPDDHASGLADAKITLVEYGDYQCPYCGAAYPIVKQLQKALGDSLRLVFRNMPLSNMHPRAEDAAEAAEAVGEQGLFWPMHDLLYEHQDDLSERSILHYAKEAGADVTAVATSITSGAPHQRVQDDLQSGLRSGVNGTPTFFVNGARYDGSWQFEPFLEYLESIVD